jgi:NAD(P)H-dependent FMN reductase
MNSTAVVDNVRVAVIVGSVRTGRFGTHVGEWVHRTLTAKDIDADVVDLVDLTFPHTMAAHPDVASFAERIGLADAVVVITPEYNHSYPGPLKTAVDALRDEWYAKPVAFVSYGGMAGGLRAVEALRLVFAELHTVTVRETVSLHNPWGPAADPTVDYPGADATGALHTMMRQLLWWAEALRTARRTEPYPS